MDSLNLNNELMELMYYQYVYALLPEEGKFLGETALERPGLLSEFSLFLPMLDDGFVKTQDVLLSKLNFVKAEVIKTVLFKDSWTLVEVYLLDL